MAIKGYSHQDLAKLLGISKQRLSNYLNDVNFPPLDILKKIAEEFEIKIELLIEDKYEFFIVYDSGNYKSVSSVLTVAEPQTHYNSTLTPEIQEKIKELITLLQKLKGQNDGMD